MKRPDSTNLLPLEVEAHLSQLLEQWANDNRLSATQARSIREGVQEHDEWHQMFWMRMNPVLIRAATVARPVPSRPWSLSLPFEADLTWVFSQGSFDAPDFCSYLSFGQ